MSQIVLEVERKFTRLAVPRLVADAGKPPFRSILYHSQTTFKDTYFDKQDKLSANGLWLRKREPLLKQPVWEAKCKKGGTFHNSMFEELTDVEAIRQAIHQITGWSATVDTTFGLDSIAEMTTTRKTWLANDQFKIVLDSMDFGHEVGEVELECKVTPPCLGSDINVEQWKRTTTQDMDNQIEAFMKCYSWAFYIGTPHGKLTAYFDQQRRRHISDGHSEVPEHQPLL